MTSGAVRPDVRKAATKVRGLPVPVWNGREETLATRAAPEAAHHIGRRPGLVDEDEMSRVQLRLVRAPGVSRGRDVRPALLGGVE